MLIGVAGPPLSVTGADPAVIRDFAQAVEAMGFNHYAFSEHVLSSDAEQIPELGRRSNIKATFNETFALMCFLAGVTSRIELFSCILILPLRPTALAAKQSAHADILSNGRVRLGVGVSGDPLEYEALGVDHATRGARLVEQIGFLRRFWTEESVTAQTRFHTFRHVGINPRPGRLIPIWMGGGSVTDPFPSERILRRAARLADGFTAISLLPPERASELIDTLRSYVAEAGREASSFGVEGDITLTDKTPDDWRRETQLWREAGADRLILRMGPRGGVDRLLATQDQIDNLKTYLKEVGLEA
ncbi:MAG TPA: TIGR03619 family F420-dependent LLM class oxidoreductase [Dehalococcoidia bacterium]|nr:TIGR03619 family F420-dependent LLM class oxidoreductase [Dehalococcoidia bacterium]